LTSTAVGTAVGTDRRRDLLWRVAIVAVAALPALVATASVVGAHWFPEGDHAYQVLRASDVGTGHTPLLGAWSRWGWHHPGPLLPWLNAPFYRLFGNDGMLVATGLMAAGFSAAASWVGLRRGGLVLGSLVTLVVCLLNGAIGLATIVDPWNPYVALLPFFLYLLLVWSVACDDLAMLPLAVAAGTFCIQAHVGYAVLVGTTGAFAVAAVLVRRLLERRALTADERPAEPEAVRAPADEPVTGDAEVERVGDRVPSGPSSGWRRTIAAFGAAALVGFVLWLPALIDQVWGSGNLSALVRFTLESDEPTQGWGEAFGVLGAQMWVPPPWADANDSLPMGLPRTAPVVQGVIGVAVVAAVALVAALRRRWSAALLGLTAVVGLAGAVASTARLSGIPYPYLVRWWWLVAAVAWLSVVWSALELLGVERRRPIAGVALAAAAVTVVGVAVRDVPVDPPNPTSSDALAHLIGPVAQQLDPGGRYVVRAKDDLNLFGAGAGMLLGLEKEGFGVYLDPDELTRLQAGEWRTLPAPEADGILLVVGLDAMDAGFRPEPGSQRLAVYDPLTPEERREFAALQEEVRAALGSAAGDGVIPITSAWTADLALDAGVPEQDVERMQELQSRGSGFAVYLQPAPVA
jgi:MFS family permease